MAFVALAKADDKVEMAGGVRLVADPDWRRGEFSIIVRSDIKRTGLGRALMSHIIDYAKRKNMSEVFGHVLRENKGMLALCEKLGFRKRDAHVDSNEVLVELMLR